MCDILSSTFSDHSVAQEAMKAVLVSMNDNFKWMKTIEGVSQLFLIKRNKSGMSSHPWVEVRKSTNNGNEGEFSYGLYACRSFKKNDCIGMYIGRLFKGTDESDVTSIFKISVGEGEIHLDIDNKGEGRLSFGFGSHMMNDRLQSKTINKATSTDKHWYHMKRKIEIQLKLIHQTKGKNNELKMKLFAALWSRAGCSQQIDHTDFSPQDVPLYSGILSFDPSTKLTILGRMAFQRMC